MPRHASGDGVDGELHLAAALAEEVGFEVSVAASGKDLRNLLTAERDPDVIVLDVVMPDEDGIELIQALASEGCAAGFILMSGYDYVGTAKKLASGKGLRVLGALRKPFALDELRAFLRQALPDG